MYNVPVTKSSIMVTLIHCTHVPRVRLICDFMGASFVPIIRLQSCFVRKPVSAACCYFLIRENENFSRENEKLSRENENLSRENEKLSRKNEKFLVKTKLSCR